MIEGNVLFLTDEEADRFVREYTQEFPVCGYSTEFVREHGMFEYYPSLKGRLTQCVKVTYRRASSCD
jgi:hypothetical protein